MPFKSTMGVCKPLALSFLVLALLPDSSLACRALHPNKAVLLHTVPAEAQGSPIIARVTLMEVYQVGNSASWWENHARARVIEAIKGVTVGQVIEIQASPWPCNSTLDRFDAGQSGFVAGAFDARQILVGFWDPRYRRDLKHL